MRRRLSARKAYFFNNMTGSFNFLPCKKLCRKGGRRRRQ